MLQHYMGADHFTVHLQMAYSISAYTPLKRADINAVDLRWHTPLHDAAARGQVALVRLLAQTSVQGQCTEVRLWKLCPGLDM
jgi:hypothetical protein